MKAKIIFIISLLFGLMFLNAGLDKLFHYMPIPADLPEPVITMGGAFATIGWVMPLVAFAEIFGAILFIIPRTRALGAIVLLPVMVGIMLAHITTAPEGLPIACVLFAILIWTIYDNRGKYLPMVSK